MSLVFVLSSDRQPLDPCHPARARQLLTRGKAAIFRRFPFTIILTDRTAAERVTHPHRVKIDPGSKTTGIAVVAEGTGRVVWAGELTHRGQQIRDRLSQRRAVRRSRRQRKTRYRQPRFLNRRRPEGWLAPSLQHRVETTLTWVNRLRRYAPIAALSVELVRFDTQQMQNAEVSGVAYQQGTLAGYEVRQYLLEKWNRRCAYCHATDVPLQIEHMTPRSRGGSDRVSNLTLACEPCNTRKGTQTAAEFGYPHLQAQARLPLKDAAAVNSTRWALSQRLVATCLPVEAGTGGRTTFNRTRLGLPKGHWMDAACVGASTPEALDTRGVRPLLIRATGHGSRQMCRMDRFGFPRTGAKQARRVKGLRTGDMVRAVVTTGKKVGTYTGRVAVRASGSFNITTANRTVQGLSYRFVRAIQRNDGYTYQPQPVPAHAEAG
ncbi:RNA-guided endonuclease IscB [Candidatus Chloroploca sp. Khr17]|uniref:RNA-guided endonuclease IscB n=1 Tax=Candidatus Chloroploca sp. Khr17 TaxID=2496869 RepID=UPI00101D27A1|nr:RNA-guided endonuclease IscB [Candidatus Chloroploca sp. Khr17]